MSFVLGRKCYFLNGTVTKFCDIGTGDFRFRFWFSAENGISFRWDIRLRLKMKNAFSVGLYIKLFLFQRIVECLKVIDYVNNFHSTIPVPDSQ